MLNLVVKNDEAGLRLDKFLCQRLDASRNYIKEHFDEDLVNVNDKIVKPSYLVKENDVVLIELKEIKDLKIEEENLHLEYVYKDDDLVVVNKPSNMVVHPAPGNYSGTLVNGLLYDLKDELSSINGVRRPGIVHRIDKDTSGLMVVCKNDFIHEKMAAMFEKHEIIRDYIALVYGVIYEDKGTIDAPISRDKDSKIKMAVQKDGKHAVTHFEVLERFDDKTLIKCRLETGRTHQIRVHLKYIGHPLVGDKIYGPRKVIGDNGQFLHSAYLEFIHPRTGKKVICEAPLPPYFEDYLDILRKN